MSGSSPSSDPSLAAEVRRRTGQNPAACYQCAKCSAGCPMATEMTLRPHEMMRLVQLDRRERLFADSSPWLCLTCETCSARCPNECEPARVFDAVRELIWEHEPHSAPRRIRAFHEAFLAGVRQHGRLFEFGLVLDYKLHSGAFFDDVANAPAMLARGKLALLPHRAAVADVRRIFARCAARAKEGGR